MGGRSFRKSIDTICFRAVSPWAAAWSPPYSGRRAVEILSSDIAKALRIAKGQLWVERKSAERHRWVLLRRTRATRRQRDACKQIAADSVDAAKRGHDISRTADPSHCLGARNERAAKNRFSH